MTITIWRELVEQARALDLTTGELFAEAIRLAVPGAFEIEIVRPLPAQYHWRIDRRRSVPVRTEEIGAIEQMAALERRHLGGLLHRVAHEIEDGVVPVGSRTWPRFGNSK